MSAARPDSFQTLRYGAEPSQEGDFYLPDAPHPPVVCLLHGGFWRMPYAREELGLVAADLAAHGFAVWNIEYRRLGEPGGGWPGTFEDVASAIDHLATIAAGGIDLDLTCVTLVGHSAGGHLALWAAARNRPDLLAAPSRVRPFAVAGLAPITDLARAFAARAGTGAVAELLGGSPDEHPDRYAATSPIELLPFGTNQLILHGTADAAVPIEHSRAHATRASALGDAVDFVELPETGHMDFLDPTTKGHKGLRNWLASLEKSKR